MGGTSKKNRQKVADVDRPSLTGKAETLFHSDAKEPIIRLFENDFPYAIPHDVQHFVLWSRLPFYPPAAGESSKLSQARQKGLHGLTGVTVIDQHADQLFMETEISDYVQKTWPPEDYQCAWFVNPPSLQSIKNVSHFHIFVKTKHATFT
ncbi:hypothetical protein PROFUN_08133 [Planoprotostelium fungivorum]|uniref:Uncharacterized protein n=1 Tax=Planoprotostelium fungivorum TaxID=1890364 RepID=A0A2P6MQH0_9EUKA|nr:hypothetical protein PROFUN_08133 [Planoprotostelium fungivorum]